MLGTSAESRDALLEQVGRVVDGDTDGGAVADGLFGAAGVLRQQGALRRALTDPSGDPDGRGALARSVFGSHLEEEATRLVAEASSRRWVSSHDMVAALEELGVAAVVAQADRDDQGDRLEDELFGFGRLLAEETELRDALTDQSRPVRDRLDLLDTLVADKVTAGARRLLGQAVSAGRGSLSRTITEYVRMAARARGRLAVLVHAAHELSEEQRDRLARTLEEQYGSPVHVDVVVEPRLMGGLRVEVGNDVYEGSVAGRLHEARRRLAG